MVSRRKTYIVATSYTATKTYEIAAHSSEEARQLIRYGYCAGLLDIKETFNVLYAHRKERVSK